MNYTDIEGVWRFARRGEVAPEGSMQTNMGWLIPVELDYEAANSYLDNIKSLMTYAEMVELVDAAYGQGAVDRRYGGTT